MAGVRYECRVSGLMSDRARDAFSDMIVQHVPPESIHLCRCGRQGASA